MRWSLLIGLLLIGGKPKVDFSHAMACKKFTSCRKLHVNDSYSHDHVKSYRIHSISMQLCTVKWIQYVGDCAMRKYPVETAFWLIQIVCGVQ